MEEWWQCSLNEDIRKLENLFLFASMKRTLIKIETEWNVMMRGIIKINRKHVCISVG